MADLMSTHEVADYLRIKERKIYDLVREKRIPCTRVTGKWLFPKRLIDAWVAEGTDVPEGVVRKTQPVPTVLAGSHDPLLEWSVRECGGDLAMNAAGSLDGVRRFAAGEAMVCALHVLDPETGVYNVPAIETLGEDAVLVEWAKREQGLVVAAGNPLKVRGVSDLGGHRARVVLRQEGAGSRILFEHLVARAGLSLADLDLVAQPARTETDLGQAVSEGKADAGLAVQAAAHAFHLDFVPLHHERLDLFVRRRDYFEPPVQALLAFARTRAFAARAAEMGGYDISENGTVRWNAP